MTRDVGDRMRGDWDRRAAEDHKFHIARAHSGSDDAFRASGEKDLREFVLDGLELDPRASVLEIGCGVGRLLLPLSSRVAAVHGVDISAVMVEKAREYCAAVPSIDVRLTQGGLGHVPDASLDFVFSFIVFQHVPEKAVIAEYVREAARVLTPGGLLRFQLDGRARPVSFRPDTYDGVNVSRSEALDLLESAELTLIDDWGERTHYFWVTAGKGPAAPGSLVSFRPRAYDPDVLADIFERAGIESARATARRVAAGELSLKDALAPFEERLARSSSEALVRTLCDVLLASTDPDAVAFHMADLAGHGDRGIVVNNVLACLEFRDLVRPFAPRPPLLRTLPLCDELGLPEDAGVFEIAAALHEELRGLSVEDAVRSGFLRVLGHAPDDAAGRYYAAFVADRRSGLRLFVRELLWAPGPTAPAAPPAERVGDLLRRSGVGIPSDEAAAEGESFAGEALALRELLRRTRGASDEAFIGEAYEAVLGRAADSGTLDWLRERLETRTVARALVVRELLWSDELRSA